MSEIKAVVATVLETYEGDAAKEAARILRARGKSYRAIERELGWPDDHGCRARRALILDHPTEGWFRAQEKSAGAR